MGSEERCLVETSGRRTVSGGDLWTSVVDVAPQNVEEEGTASKTDPILVTSTDVVAADAVCNPADLVWSEFEELREDGIGGTVSGGDLWTSGVDVAPQCVE